MLEKIEYELIAGDVYVLGSNLKLVLGYSTIDALENCINLIVMDLGTLDLKYEDGVSHICYHDLQIEYYQKVIEYVVHNKIEDLSKVSINIEKHFKTIMKDNLLVRPLCIDVDIIKSWYVTNLLQNSELPKLFYDYDSACSERVAELEAQREKEAREREEYLASLEYINDFTVQKGVVYKYPESNNAFIYLGQNRNLDYGILSINQSQINEINDLIDGYLTKGVKLTYVDMLIGKLLTDIFRSNKIKIVKNLPAVENKNLLHNEWVLSLQQYNNQFIGLAMNKQQLTIDF